MLRLSRATALTLVFFSGATGLIYEFCWSKRLANWLGNTGQAHAILLATFMGGLALGAWLFGRRADRSQRPLQLYGVLEIGVGVLALLFPTVLEAMGTLYVKVGAVGGNPARLLLAVVTVLPPALLMGGSLPAMTRALTTALGSAKSTLAKLYALNSLGAAVGSLLAGLLFVPVSGLAVTERFAVMLNVLVGVLAILGGRAPMKLDEAEASAASGDDGGARVYDSVAVRAVLIGTALSGFTAMLYEVTWIRLLSIIIGGTSYAFTLILSAFIFGIALGSFWIARRKDTDALRTFGVLQLLLVIAVVLTIPLYRRLPFIFFHLTQLLRPDTSWNVYLFLTFAFCGLLLIPPTFLMGASFPLGARVVMRSRDTVGGEVGRVYLYNTVGTILGSLLGGLVLLPLIGLEGNFTVGLIANLTAAALCLWPGGEARTRRLLAGAAVLILASAVTSRGWSTFISEAGRYREWKGHFSDFATFEQEAKSRAHTLFYADDVFASVMVAEQKGEHRFLRINGKADGSNDRGDLDTQALAAHLGVLLHPGQVKRVLLVGIGAGITAGSLLAHEGLERLDVVEISPAVIDAAAVFAQDNRNALKDPRCHVYIEDARTFLTLSPEKYDLIVSVPSNPWVTGVSGLFSRDFFRVARERLAPGGRMVQWIHTYESNEALVKLVVRTLRDSFEHGTTWLGAADMLLIASREPQVIDLAAMERRMRPPDVALDLKRLNVTLVTTLLARQVHSDEGQLEFAGEGPINTDDHNLLEYLSPIAYFRSGEAVSLYDERIATDGQRLEFYAWQQKRKLRPHQWAELYFSLRGVHDDREKVLRSVARAWLLSAPDSVDAAMAVARCELADGEFALAVQTLTPFVRNIKLDPDFAALWELATKADLENSKSMFFTPPEPPQEPPPPPGPQ